jgi:phosphoribosylamine--glycine ligase
MITKRGIVMVDAYATFGSTETLNNLTLLRSQLGDVLLSIVEGSLKQLSFYEMATVAKYLVPEKYPKTTRKGEIKMDERILWNNGCKAYLHSVRTGKGKIYTSKGRSLAICAKALSVKEADAMVEAAMAAVTGKLRHRDDIASMKYINRMVKRTALLRGYPA